MRRFSLSLSLVLLACCLVASATAQSATNVVAYWFNFLALEYDFNLTTARVGCATYDADKPFEWRSKYNWVSFSGPDGPYLPEACGMCIKVINIRTGAQTTVRIVDSWGGNGLNLDKPAFDELNTDGQGYFLVVNYEFVDCGDPTIRLYSE